MTAEEVRAISARKFRRAWEESGLTQKEFVERITEHGARTDLADFNRIATGLLRLSESRIAALCNATGHNPGWFFTPNGHGPL